ncbi:MAG: DUF1772 domain-containing protein [Alphaproteobacteria bacterium]
MMTSPRSFARDTAFFVALLATSVALGGALAHAFELPNKIGLGRDAYFVVQQIYAGWNRLGFVLLAELAGMIAVIYLYRGEARVLWPAGAALAALIAAQIVFWVWTFPANQATANWTRQPANWEALRAQWEYSHLAGAAFQTIAMAALILAVLRRSPRHTNL